MNDTVKSEPRAALLAWLQSRTGDDLARAVIANGVWGDTPAYRILAEQLDPDTIHGMVAEAQLREPGPPLSKRPQPRKFKGTVFEDHLFDAAIIITKHPREMKEADHG